MNDLIVVPPTVHQLSCWDAKRKMPKFMFEKYKGMEVDIVDFYRSLYFYELWNGESDTIGRTKEMAELDAKARMNALIQTGTLADAFDDATILQLHSAQTDGWYAELGENDIQGVKELIEVALGRQIEKDPTGGIRYEYQKLLQVINVIEQMMLHSAQQNGGVDAKVKDTITKAITGMVANPHTRSKMRESAKIVNEILESDADKEEKLQASAEVFHDVADSEVTFAEFRAKNKLRMRSVGKHVPDMVPGAVYLMSGKEYIVIESTGEHTTRAIESALKGLVDEFDVKDPANLIRSLTDALYTKGKFEKYEISDDKLVPDVDGVKLPTPDNFKELAIREAANAKIYIMQMRGLSFIPVYNIYRSIRTFNATKLLCEMFGEEENYDRSKDISKMIANNYEVPSDVKAMFEGYRIWIGVMASPTSVDISLCLEEGKRSEGVHRRSKVQE